MNKARTIYFYRKYNRFTGGHLKVWDYFNHIKMAGDYLPFIYLEPGGDVSENNPWLSLTQNQLPEWIPSNADLLFIGGTDWFSLPFPERQNWPMPIINLVQHVRHAQHGTPLYECLSNYAIRICVSQEVSNAILATGKVNGPVFTIPNGIDYSFFTRNNLANNKKDVDLLIVGLKNPRMAKELVKACKDLPVTIKCLTEQLPRLDFIRTIASSRLAVLLPNVTEGFYLPALEAMASKTLVICPDCIGNRSFCQDNYNCIIPPYSVNEILEAIVRTLKLSDLEFNNIILRAHDTVLKYNIEQEQQLFYKILQQLESLWN